MNSCFQIFKNSTLKLDKPEICDDININTSLKSIVMVKEGGAVLPSALLAQSGPVLQTSEHVFFLFHQVEKHGDYFLAVNHVKRDSVKLYNTLSLK